MSGQLALFDRYEMWTLGATEKCVRGRGDCRFQPCTVVQGVRCCAACEFKCASPCEKIGRRRK